MICSNIAYVRLVFPTLQQNTSAMAILPTFLDTLGRKIESAEREKDIQGKHPSHNHNKIHKASTSSLAPLPWSIELQEKQLARDFDRAKQYFVCNTLDMSGDACTQQIFQSWNSIKHPTWGTQHQLESPSPKWISSTTSCLSCRGRLTHQRRATKSPALRY